MKRVIIEQIAVELAEIRNLGFVPTMRAGNTGIGYTLETLFGIAENNVRTPDFGEIELKSQRKNVTTPITRSLLIRAHGTSSKATLSKHSDI